MLIYECEWVRMGVLVCRDNTIMLGNTRGIEYVSDLGVCMAGKFPGTSCDDMHDPKKLKTSNKHTAHGSRPA